MPEVTQLVIKELWLNPCTPAPEYNACSNSNGERHVRRYCGTWKVHLTQRKKVSNRK